MAEEETPDMETTNDFGKLKVVDLKRMLKAKGLSTAGNKQELVERLQQSDAAMEDLLEGGHPGEEAFDEELEEIDETALMGDEKELPPDEDKDKLSHDADSKLEEGAEEEPPNKKKKVSINRASASLLPEEEEEGGGGGGGEGEGGGEEGVSGGGEGEKSGADQERRSSPSSASPPASVTAPGETPKEDPSPNAEKKIIKIKDLSTIEKLSLRAQKFGLSESAKKEMRAARFGITTQLTMQETLDKRAKRFGSASDLSDKKVKAPSEGSGAADPSVLKKRAERFGLALSTKQKEEYEKKLEQRKERFRGGGGGGAGGGGGGGAATGTTAAGEEKKALRAQRFKVATT